MTNDTFLQLPEENLTFEERYADLIEYYKQNNIQWRIATYENDP